MAKHRFKIAVLALLVSLGTFTFLAANGGAASVGEPLEGFLSTPGAVSVEGSSALEASEGAIHLKTASWEEDGFNLEADQVSVEMTWRRGVRVNPGLAGEETRVNEGAGEAVSDLTSVTGSVSLTEDDPFEALAHSTENPVELEMISQGSSFYTPVSNETVTAYEWSPEAQSVGETPRPGFWYTTGSAEIASHGFDTVLLEGDFTLFLNNATVILEGENERGETTEWNNWTGIRSEELGPGATSREVRATVLHVRGGQLTIDAPDQLEAYTPEATVDAEGSLTSERVVGRLVQDTTAYTFAPAPLALEGSGLLSMRAATSSSGVGATTVPGLVNMEVQTDGEFTVAPTEGLHTEAITTEDGGAAPWFSAKAWGAALLGLVAVSAGGLGVTRFRSKGPDEDPSPEPVAPEFETCSGQQLPAEGSRREAFEDELARGRALYDDLDFGAAAEVFKDLTETYPPMPQPWVYLGDALMELGRYDAAVQAYRSFGKTMDQPEPDAFAKQLRALAQAGKYEEAVSVLDRLAQIDGEMAARELLRRPDIAQIALASDLSPGIEMLDTWIRGAWARDRRDEAARALTKLIEREPHMAFHYCLDREYDPLCQRVFSRLRPGALKTLVEVLWHTDRLELASDAMLHLAKESPELARQLVEDPIYAPLSDDVRIARVVGQ